MNNDFIIRLLKQSANYDLEIEARTSDRYMVHTGYTYPDGDELHIILTKDDDGWVLTDEGHTMMWLSYENFNITDTRRTLLDRTLNHSGVSLTDGVLSIRCPTDPDTVGTALRSIVTTELRMADLLYLDKETVRDTFLDDLVTTFTNSDLADRCQFNKAIIDDNTEYHADIYIDGNKPILIFGIHSPIQCTRATVTMLSLNRHENKYLFMTVFDHNMQISEKDVEKAINASIKTAYGLNEAVIGAKRLIAFSR